MNIVYTILFSIMPLLLFIIDIAVCNLSNYYWLSLLLGWYSVEISLNPNYQQVFITLCFICLESIIFYNSIMLPLYYFIPLTVIVLIAHKRVHYYSWYPLIVATLVTLPLWLPWMPFSLPMARYTLWPLCVTLLSVYIFSLIYKSKVNKTIA